MIFYDQQDHQNVMIMIIKIIKIKTLGIEHKKHQKIKS